MVDWVTVTLPMPRHVQAFDWLLAGGATVIYRPGGDISHVVPAWLPVEGSFAAAMRLRLTARGLVVSGNPIKFLSGQNLDGPDDLYGLVAAIVPRLCRAVGLPIVYSVQDAILTRVDATYNLDLGAIERVREVLRVAGITARARHQGRSSLAGSTVYLGKHSTRHSVKLYCKADELQVHGVAGLPSSVAESMLEVSSGLLRAEVTVRGAQLRQDGLARLSSWRDRFLVSMYWRRYMSAVTISSAVNLSDDEVLALPRRLRATYELWRRGVDCPEFLSRATYYRHRVDLLSWSAGRVDIAVQRPALLGQAVSVVDIGAVLRSAPIWSSSGLLSEWIASSIAA